MSAAADVPEKLRTNSSYRQRKKVIKQQIQSAYEVTSDFKPTTGPTSNLDDSDKGEVTQPRIRERPKTSHP